MYLFRRLLLIICLSSPFSVFAEKVNACTYSNTVSAVAKETGKFTPLQDTNLVIIRFGYKQSALFYAYTLEVVDSVVNILLRDTAVSISIDGFAHMDEGSDTVCYYLSLNRALFLQTYILGRGVELTRIRHIKAHGKVLKAFKTKDSNGFYINCRAELTLIFPPPPKKIEIFDRDEDGIEDNDDKCPDVFGIAEMQGCPDSAGIMIPFAMQESALTPQTYAALDSVVKVLKDDPSLSISIGGYAHLAEGAYSLCKRLAAERADITRLYLISRQINPARIITVTSFGISRPINPAKNPQQVMENARSEIRILK